MVVVPNPIHQGIALVTLNGISNRKCMISVVDVLGREVVAPTRLERGTGSSLVTPVNLSGLSSGTYVVVAQIGAEMLLKTVTVVNGE